MGYGRKIYEEAVERLETQRLSRERSAELKRESFYQLYPRAGEIKNEMAKNAQSVASAVIKGGNVKEEAERLRKKSEELNAEYDGLLKAAGLTRADITPRYSCEKCRDTGFVDGRMCSCLKQLQRSLAYEKLSMSVPLEKCSFKSFSLEYYRCDERAYKQMENIFKACKSYAARFRKNSPSMLFRGGTGLGKTHLSLAIAAAAIEKGFGVVYGSAQSFAVALEKERFERHEDELDDTRSQLISCDLLIMDDLGTEFGSSYVNAALYDIVNTRMLSEKPTIISTNLTMKELQDRYSERFASRIAGYYGKLEFLGEDVRVQQRKRKAEKKQ